MIRSIASFLAASGLTIVALAAPQGAPAPATAPALPTVHLAEHLSAQEIQAQIVEQVEFVNAPLSDILEYLQQIHPQFQAVIIRDPMTPPDYPAIPPMKLKHATLEQILQILQAAVPNLEVSPIESEKGSTIFTVHVHAPISGSGDATAFRVYRLAEALDAIEARNHKVPAAGGANPANAALPQVLSLVKASLAQAGDNSIPPIVQVHEETQTLLVRGTPAQIDAVQMALQALLPAGSAAPVSEKTKLEQQELKEQAMRLGNQVEQLRQELDVAKSSMADQQKHAEELKKIAFEREAEAERAKVRLELLQQKAAEDSAHKSPK